MALWMGETANFPRQFTAQIPKCTNSRTFMAVNDQYLIPGLFPFSRLCGNPEQCGMCDQQSLRSACAYMQSDQSLSLSLEYSMTVKLLTEHHLEFLCLKGGCTGWSESTLVKMPHCWKSHVTAQLPIIVSLELTSLALKPEASSLFPGSNSCCSLWLGLDRNSSILKLSGVGSSAGLIGRRYLDCSRESSLSNVVLVL